MTRVELAKQLGIPRTSLNNHIKNGCPTDDVQSASAWIQNHKREPLGTQDHYTSSAVDGKDSEARFNRLLENEAYVSGQIQTLQRDILPNLVSQLTDDPDNKAIQTKLSRANQDLIAYRKSLLSISKLISDIEFKRQAAAGDTVPVGFVKDVITNVLMSGITQYAHHSKKGEIIMSILLENIDSVINAVSGAVPMGYAE